MNDMPRCGKGIALSLVAPLALAAGIGCGGDQGPVDQVDFQPIPLAPCGRDLGDGLTPDQRSLSAMLAALHTRSYPLHQVSPVEMTIYTQYRDVRGVSVAWQARFQSDGSGELGIPETMPPQDGRTAGLLREWGRAVVETFNHLKCLPRDRLRAQCEKAGFSF